MLILEPTAAIRSSFWAPGAAFAILRDDATIGRIDMGGGPLGTKWPGFPSGSDPLNATSTQRERHAGRMFLRDG